MWVPWNIVFCGMVDIWQCAMVDLFFAHFCWYLLPVFRIFLGTSWRWPWWPCLSLSLTTSSTFGAAQTFPPHLFPALSRKVRTKDRVKSCLPESHLMPSKKDFLSSLCCLFKALFKGLWKNSSAQAENDISALFLLLFFFWSFFCHGKRAENTQNLQQGQFLGVICWPLNAK